MYTKGDWKAYQTDIKPERWTICAGNTGEQGIAKTVLDNAIPPAEKKANAELISAAPDLYEACEQALRTFEAHRIKPTDPRYMGLAKALAKAEGK